MLLCRVHLAKGFGLALCDEDRVKAEALFAARRPDKLALDRALEDFLMTVRPDDGEGRDEAGAAVGGLNLFQQGLNLLHGDIEIARLARPDGCMNTRHAAKRRHLKTAIVGKRRGAGRLACGACLDEGIAGKGLFGLFRLRQVQIDGGDDFHADRFEKILQFADFPLVMCCRDEPAFLKFASHDWMWLRSCFLCERYYR